MGRLGLTEELADAIVFMASDEASSSPVTSSMSTAVTPRTDEAPNAELPDRRRWSAPR